MTKLDHEKQNKKDKAKRPLSDEPDVDSTPSGMADPWQSNPRLNEVLEREGRKRAAGFLAATTGKNYRKKLSQLQSIWYKNPDLLTEDQQQALSILLKKKMSTEYDELVHDLKSIQKMLSSLKAGSKKGNSPSR